MGTRLYTVCPYCQNALPLRLFKIHPSLSVSHHFKTVFLIHSVPNVLSFKTVLINS